MISTSRGSRRAFVVGGGAALVSAPWALAQLGQQAAKRMTEDASGVTAPPSEVAGWEALVGATFLVAGDVGNAVAKLVAVERPAVDRDRPAALARFQPFTAYLEMEPRLAPSGQQTHRVTHPLDGATDLFLARGADKRGKAVLLALFN